MFKGQKSSLTVKHVTNYNVVAIKFSPFESGKLLTCGRDSIRFYRLKDGQLRGCSIQFGDLKAVQDSKSVPRGDIGKNVFTEIAFEAGYGLADHDERHVFVSSVGGAVFQINYGQRRLECVYQLHNGAINNLIVSEGFCITGSDDKFLRVWPVDFSDFFLEVEHDSPVTGVGISPNQLQVCIGTEKGSVGTMDIPSHKYVTLLRSHTDDIRQVAADPMHAEYTTVSLDGSIRVWSDATHKQLFEFDAKGQVPTCVMYHPKEYVFACGFESGIVRVYNIERTSLLQEHCQHKGAVTEVLFTPNGGLLLTAGSEGNICVYDVAQNYMPVKYLAASLPKKPIAMSISKDGKYLATSGAEPNSVLLFDAETLAPISKVESPSGGLSKVMLSPNSNQLFVTTTDRKLECFEVPSGRFQYQMGTIHRTDCEAFDIHSSGQYVVTGGHDNLLKVWDCSPESVSSKRPGCQKFIAHSEGVSSMVLNRSSTKVISVGCSDTIYIWKWVGKPEGAEEPLSLEEAIVESALGMGDDDFAPGPPMPLPGVHWTETSPDEGLEANQVDPQCQTSIGFNGSAHSNVVWNAERGVFAYSNENSVVVEDLKTKKQEFLTLHTQSISTLALNKSGTLLASGPGAPEVERGMAPVYVGPWHELVRAAALLPQDRGAGSDYLRRRHVGGLCRLRPRVFCGGLAPPHRGHGCRGHHEDPFPRARLAPPGRHARVHHRGLGLRAALAPLRGSPRQQDAAPACRPHAAALHSGVLREQLAYLHRGQFRVRVAYRGPGGCHLRQVHGGHRGGGHIAVRQRGAAHGGEFRVRAHAARSGRVRQWRGLHRFAAPHR